MFSTGFTGSPGFEKEGTNQARLGRRRLMSETHETEKATNRIHRILCILFILSVEKTWSSL
jgi:hypothetical protein